MEALKPWLKTQSLVLGHGKQPLHAALNLAFTRSGVTALIGKNGTGKSTFLKALLGESVLLSGGILLFDRPAQQVESVAYVAQEPQYPGQLLLKDALHLAFLKDLGWIGRLTNAQRREAEEFSVMFNLGPLQDRPLARLSPGERQRAFLAQALLQKPRLLLLDEPTNHLDPEARYFFWSALEGVLAQRPCEVLVSTHDLDFARKRANAICAFRREGLDYFSKPLDFWTLENIARTFGEGPARAWMSSGA